MPTTEENGEPHGWGAVDSGQDGDDVAAGEERDQPDLGLGEVAVVDVEGLAA